VTDEVEVWLDADFLERTRVGTLSNVTSPSFVGALNFQLYLDGNGNALELGVDASEVTGAMAYAQNVASGDFEGAYAFAAQGFWTASVTTYPAWSAAGITSISADWTSADALRSIRVSDRATWTGKFGSLPYLIGIPIMCMKSSRSTHYAHQYRHR
jgi:hypothetical protein